MELALYVMAAEAGGYENQYSELKKRLRDTESQNEEMILRIQRTKKLIQRARLERTILLERLEQSTGVADAEPVIESPPLSPIDPPPQGSGIGSGANEKKKEPNERKRTMPRDPRLPKRPQNAYIIFCDSEKDRVRKEIEAKTLGVGETHDLTKAMAEAWKQLGAEGRKVYTEKYHEDRLRYLRAMSTFPSNGLNATDQKEKQRAMKQLKEIEEQDKSQGESGEEQTEDERERQKAELRSEEPQSEPTSEPPGQV